MTLHRVIARARAWAPALLPLLLLLAPLAPARADLYVIESTAPSIKPGSRIADSDRLVLHPVVRDDDRARSEPPELLWAIQSEGDDGVIDGDRRNRERIALRVRHANADLSGVEFDAADFELVCRRRVMAQQVGDAPAPGAERGDDGDDKEERRQRP